MTLPAAILKADDLLRGRFPAPKSVPTALPEIKVNAVGGADVFAGESAKPKARVGASSRIQPPKMQIQCGDNLCWAAVIQWLRAFFRKVPLRQCDIAQRHLSRVPLITPAETCCPSETECSLSAGSRCDKRASLELAMDSLELGKPSPHASGLLKVAGLPAPPVPCRFDGDFEHFCVVSRFGHLGGTAVATLLEPKSGAEVCFKLDRPDFPHPHYNLRCTHFYPMAATAGENTQ